MLIMGLPCSLRTVFTMRFCLQRPRPLSKWIHHDFNCHMNERETSKTCLTNHKGSISHHNTPLVINSLRGGHTHTHAGILTSWTKAISRNQLHAGQRPVHAWFNNYNNDIKQKTDC